MKTNYTATILGSVIAAISFACTWTLVPLLTIIPIGLPLELIFGKLLEGSDYAATASGVMITLILLFLLIGWWFIKTVEKDSKEKREFNTIRLMFFFAIQIIIIHPMVFYIWAAINSQNAGDGQFIFGVVETFPISSILFAVLGLSIDLIKNKPTLANKQ